MEPTTAFEVLQFMDRIKVAMDAAGRGSHKAFNLLENLDALGFELKKRPDAPVGAAKEILNAAGLLRRKGEPEADEGQDQISV
jgi:hypothetical protein